MKTHVMIIFCAALLSGCASQTPSTQSTQEEVATSPTTFHTESPAATASKMISPVLH